jgi:hypothetical protein
VLRTIGYILASTDWAHGSGNFPAWRYGNSACGWIASHKNMGNYMIRSLFMRALLAALALSLGDASVALAAGIQQPLNIGFVLYSKGNAPGTLNARWTYQNIYSGKGFATGGPKEGFAGHYHVRYNDEQGKFSDEYDLVIEKAGAFYNASWLTNGNLSAGGVGMEVENGLAIGWRRVAD